MGIKLLEYGGISCDNTPDQGCTKELLLPALKFNQRGLQKIIKKRWEGYRITGLRGGRGNARRPGTGEALSEPRALQEDFLSGRRTKLPFLGEGRPAAVSTPEKAYTRLHSSSQGRLLLSLHLLCCVPLRTGNWDQGWRASDKWGNGTEANRIPSSSLHYRLLNWSGPLMEKNRSFHSKVIQRFCYSTILM